MQVEGELVGLLHDLEALAVGLHEPVLDAVVDHLHEVAGAHRPHVGVAALGGEGQEDRLATATTAFVAADHQAVAVGEPPDPARGAGVDEADAPFGQRGGRGRGLLVVGVPAVDDDVAALHEPLEGRRWSTSVGAPAGTITQATRGGSSLRHHLLQGGGGSGPLGGDRGAGSCGQVEGDHLVPLLDEALGHVGAHLPQPHHADLHRVSFPSVCLQRRTWLSTGLRPMSPGRDATRRTRRPWASRLRWSPMAWAAMRVPKS